MSAVARTGDHRRPERELLTVAALRADNPREMEGVVIVLMVLIVAVALFALPCFLTSRSSDLAFIGGWLVPAGIGALYFVAWMNEKHSDGGDPQPGLVVIVGIAAATPPLLGAIVGTIWGWGRSPDDD